VKEMKKILELLIAFGVVPAVRARDIEKQGRTHDLEACGKYGCTY
jgi:hypothetical protein